MVLNENNGANPINLIKFIDDYFKGNQFELSFEQIKVALEMCKSIQDRCYSELKLKDI